jgi:diguanylate cyclase (GGDEF)-like protein
MLQRIFAILHSIALLTFFARGIAVIKIGKAMTLTSSNFFNSIAFLSLYIVMLIGSIGFILLAKEKADMKLFIAATYDQMTGIYNRGSFIGNAAALISLCARKERPVSLLLIDLDHFKMINDTHGHQVGDIVLKEFAQTIKSRLRKYDLFGRYGGEEFVILLPETDSETAYEIAERLRDGIEHSTVDMSGGISYTISIGGVSIIPNQGTTIEMLFDLTDKALYQAKEKGRNRVEFDRRNQSAADRKERTSDFS